MTLTDGNKYNTVGVENQEFLKLQQSFWVASFAPNVFSLNENIQKEKESVDDDFSEKENAVLEYLSRKHYLLLLDEETGKEYLIRAPKRGDHVYEKVYLRRRIREIKNSLSEVVKVRGRKRGSTNTFFVTLTFARKTKEGKPISRDEAWKMLSEAWRRFQKKFSSLEVEKFIRVCEAHHDGYPHVHVLVVMKRSFSIHEIGGRWWFRKKEDFFHLKRDFSLAWGMGFIDIIPVGSLNEVVGYLMKYLVKGFTLGDEKEKNTEAYQKKIYLLYYSYLYHLRSFTTNLGLRLDNVYINNCPVVSKNFIFRGILNVGEVIKKYPFLSFLAHEDVYWVVFSDVGVEEVYMRKDTLSPG